LAKKKKNLHFYVHIQTCIPTDMCLSLNRLEARRSGCSGLEEGRSANYRNSANYRIVFVPVGNKVPCLKIALSLLIRASAWVSARVTGGTR